MNLAQLVTDPIQFHRVAGSITAIVERSFTEDGSRQTQNEARRRGEICLSIFSQLRGDLGWSTTRALDHLPRYLRSELDGQPWKPDNRSAWSPANEVNQ
jgi:hypothetical protein